MSLRKWCYGSLMAVFAALVLGMPLRASADLYQIVDLGSTFHNEMFGLTSTGDVVVHYLYGNRVCVGNPVCWGVFAKDGGVSFFDTAPPLTYDTGGGWWTCNNSGIPIPHDDTAVHICNNGRLAFTYADNVQLWTGPDPVGGLATIDQLTLLFNGETMPVFLNSEGDVAFGTFSRNFVAYDLGPTPEPSSLLLLATGSLGAASLLRRRLRGDRRP